MNAVYSAGSLEVRPAERRVLLRGEPLALGTRAFDLLLALIEHRDRVVSKDELLALAWPGVVVEENNLTVQVSALRKVIGAEAIATVAGRGYRFALPISETENTQSSGSMAPASVPNNLPAERSSFIGREPQIAAVRQLLHAHRHVTLTGIGGAGKTRLALRAAALELQRFTDGVYFVDLGPVSDARFVVPAVASACDVTAGDSPIGSSRTLTHRLVAALAPRKALLVVDNCEHLLDASTELIDTLLNHCTRLAVLATSREALALEGEQLLSVPPLSLPVGELGEQVSDAMRLFAERARAANADFVLDASTREPVAEICRRLDGIPLAIEFAAARMAQLSAAEVAERLDDRLRLLGGGRRRLAHQQTLAATLDWSHGLLSEREQTLFRRLGVFAGGFSLGAAESICSGDGITIAEVLGLLASLVSKSLVVVSTDDGFGDTRYRLLETVRLYAADKLEAAGETVNWRARHRDAWLAWLQAIPLQALTIDLDAIAEVSREINHLRSAALACVADDRPELLARLAGRVLGLYHTGNWYRFSAQLLEQALAQAHRLTAYERVACHAALSVMYFMANDAIIGLRHAEQALDGAADQCAELGELQTAALTMRGFGLAVQGSLPGADAGLAERARRDAAQAVAQAVALAPGWRAFCQIWAADVEMMLGDALASAGWAQAAERSCHEAAIPRSWVLGSALTKATVTQHLLGRHAEALATALRALAHFRSLREPRPAMIDGWTVELAPALHMGGRPALAQQVLRQGAIALRRNGVDQAPNQFLIVAAAVEALRGQHRRSATLLGAARSAGGADKQVMAFRTPTSMGLYLHYVPLVRAALGAEDARRLRDEGRAMTIDVAFAHALEGIEAAQN